MSTRSRLIAVPSALLVLGARFLFVAATLLFLTPLHGEPVTACPPFVGVPIVQGRVILQELGDGSAVIGFNNAGSRPTATFIEPATGEELRLLPPTATAEEARARFAEFIDDHPELFGAPSIDFDLRASPFSSTVWRLGALQNHRGLPVERAYIQFDVRKDGRLWLSLNARTFPADDLSSLDLEPAVSPDEAIAAVLRALPAARVVSEPELRIAFRCTEPLAAWFLSVDGAYRFVVTGDTGEVLAIDCLFDLEVGFCGPMSAFVRGDANEDGVIDVSDAIQMLTGLFVSKSIPGCVDAADANDDGQVDISDAIHELRYLFLGGQAPPAPFPHAGPDVTIDDLPCQRGL